MSRDCAEKKLGSVYTVHTNKYIVFKNIACMYRNNVSNPFHKMPFTTALTNNNLKFLF